ncbi:MAG: (2Fe-2S) ferredoxin domain-containing protein [Bacillota bacterium]
MLKVTICIGSNCHVKGSKKVIEELQYLVTTGDLKEKINLAGAFCTGDCGKQCGEGVSVVVGEKHFSINPSETKALFEKEILPLI